MSMKTDHTFSPSFIQSFSKSMNLLSLIILSISLPTSIELNFGGPSSNLGELKGRNSAVTIRFPLSLESGYGSPTPIFTPTRTSVFPILTLTLPSAFFETFGSIVISLNSSSFLPSNLLPSSKYFLILSLVISDVSYNSAIILPPLQRPLMLFSELHRLFAMPFLPSQLLPSTALFLFFHQV